LTRWVLVAPDCIALTRVVSAHGSVSGKENCVNDGGDTVETFERDRLKHYTNRSFDAFQNWTRAILGMAFWSIAWIILAVTWVLGETSPALFLSLSVPLLLGLLYYHFQQRMRGHRYLRYESQLNVFSAQLSVKYKKPIERLFEE